MSAVPGGEAGELVDGEFNGGMFEVWWELEETIGRVMQLLRETINK